MSGNQGKKARFVSFIVQHRRKVLLFVLIAVVAFSVGATRIRSDVILYHLFPQNHPYLKLYQRFSRIFGGGGTSLVIAVNARSGDIFRQPILEKIRTMTREIELWDEVYRVLTVSMASNSTKVVKTKARGEIVIESLMFPEVPKNEQEMALLKKHVFSNPAYNGTLVSSDGSAALILTEMRPEISYEEMFGKLRGMVERFSDEETSVHVVGFPMLMGWIYSYRSQMYWVFAISIGLMVLILFLSFRNLVGMIAPIVMSAICTALGLGFIGWTGINFSPLQYVLAFLVGARMLSNAVQITHRYIEEFRVSGDRAQAADMTMHAMLMPNAAAVATDAAGFLVLGLAKIVLMQQVAILMSFWMVTILLEGMLVPLICSYLPIRRESGSGRRDAGGPGWVARANMALARFSTTVGRFPVAAFVVLVLVAGTWFTTHLKVGDPTPGSPILWPDHTYNRDQALINEKFKASSDNLQLYFEGKPKSVYDPAVLKTFEQFSQYMAETLPDIYKSSNSIINLGKMLNVVWHEGDVVHYQLPRREDELTYLLAFVSNTAGNAVLRRYIDNHQERTQITLFFSDHTSDNLLRIRRAAYAFFKDHPMELESGRFLLAGGRIGMEIALNEEMKQTHAVMDLLVLFTIFLMCSMTFRSVVAGLMLTAPLILSNLIAFSYMAFANIGLTTSTLPCSAVGVGVGVDFAIYLYSRCIEEFPRQDGWRDTIMEAVKTAGTGIVFTGVTLILPILMWYFISALKFQAQMGFFLAMLLFMNMIAAFTVHPLLILLVKPHFMQRRALEGESG